jgi:hypothetical protein
MHGAGVSLLVGTTSSDLALAFGFTYLPRLNFIENNQLSVSAGIPLTLAFSGSYSYNNNNGYVSEENTLGITVNVPVMINLNMGRGSTKANQKKFGYFFGAGYGYHQGDFYVDLLNINGTEDVSVRKYSVNGPAANAGIRIGVGRKHRNIEVRFSYMKGLNEIKPNIFGIGGAFNF